MNMWKRWIWLSFMVVIAWPVICAAGTSDCPDTANGLGDMTILDMQALKVISGRKYEPAHVGMISGKIVDRKIILWDEAHAGRQKDIQQSIKNGYCNVQGKEVGVSVSVRSMNSQ